jgi:branched-chain amino acid transport system permease protein
MRAALLFEAAGLPMEPALVARRRCCAGWPRLVFGWFCVRLSGVYLAMLTLAFAQIVLVDRVPVGWRDRRQQRRDRRVAAAVARPTRRTYYWPRARRWRSSGVYCLRRMLFSPFGYALRAGRDSPLRAEAIGIDVRGVQWAAFVLAGAVCRLGGRPVRLLQGQHLARRPSRSAQSIDGLVMVLLGGVQTAGRPGGGRRALHLAAATPSPARPTTGALLLGAVILLLRARCSRRAWSAASAARAAARGSSAHERRWPRRSKGCAKAFGGVPGRRRRLASHLARASCWR